ncbi:alpha/beta hydrolase family protein [Alicyclobacillus macrosporangiidus]|uniref:alpha/beta hydrolase family protein n=1 Tax=Alicyclobacillus macrosporangiidus TaxID=392015 RepID=UPI0018CC3A5D|nr:alpha/beta hydrolase [Alicyclobacillus macrosporangiidus]
MGEYREYGWEQWPEYPWMSYQFRRALGETQEGGGSVSECLQAAQRMVPGDRESWHKEWMRIAERNRAKAYREEAAGHFVTARACFLRACNYFRCAEFWLEPNDPRRLPTFTKCEECFEAASRYFDHKAVRVDIPYEGTFLPAYFIRSRFAPPKSPVLIALGGLDSFKEELYFMLGRGALERGISCLLVDGPGQGAALRRLHLTTRFDYEVPVGACVDYLETRDDVDFDRIALSGSSLGGYYAVRAAAFEKRIRACIAHGAQWNVARDWSTRGDDHPLALHIRWVFGVRTMAEALLKAQQFNLEPVVGKLDIPLLIVHGARDMIGVEKARQLYRGALEAGVDVTLRMVSPEETGAEHCQHDNPTLAHEYVFDWLNDVWKIVESVHR